MSKDCETSDMTLEGLGEMFEGDSANMCGRKFPLVSMGDERIRQACEMWNEDPHWREQKLFKPCD